MRNPTSVEKLGLLGGRLRLGPGSTVHLGWAIVAGWKPPAAG